MMQRKFARFLAVLLAAACCLAVAEDVVTFESTITGSQEQPKVIYIVPWQPPQPPAAMNKPIANLVMQDLLQPIDRDAFLRQVQYRALLTERASGGGLPQP
jgi:hypothetical protein